MIVPMKKLSLITPAGKKEQVLKKLRKLGIVHIEISEGESPRLESLRRQIASLENALYLVGKPKKEEQKELSTSEALALAEKLEELSEEKKKLIGQQSALSAEWERIKPWGDVDPREIEELKSLGVPLCFYEASKAEYAALPETVQTLRLETGKATVKFALIPSGTQEEKERMASLEGCRFELPQVSAKELKEQLDALSQRLLAMEESVASAASFQEGMKQAIAALEKELEFEGFSTGMAQEDLASVGAKECAVNYFKGYVEASRLEELKQLARENAWGLLAQDPCEEDNPPTKLKNNKFVSLIYPILDFLGTVPGYFEYDISGWFLGFILVFFGIIFGDGGYGLLICAAALGLILNDRRKKKSVSPAFLLVGLFGLSTVLWGTLTCTWFGLAPEYLPAWLKSLSLPVLSNVYADKIWYPFWTGGTAGLTTEQNVQIFCFSLALIQLSVAHIKGAVRYRRSLKMLGAVGSVFQLLGIFYLVLSLVVNPAVFPFDLVLGGIPVGTVVLALIGVGFLMTFVFSNYEGSLGKAVLASLANIVSVLLGVVNVFSDIVSYIRLWAVGLAGAAISATVNELVGPILGDMMFLVLAIVLLVFGHGLNMILNVLSVIVHGIRLNTLEFSSHLDMSWSGHKFKPFQE